GEGEVSAKVPRVLGPRDRVRVEGERDRRGPLRAHGPQAPLEGAREAVLLHGPRFPVARPRVAFELAGGGKEDRIAAAHVLRSVVERRLVEIKKLALAHAERGDDRAA